MEWPAHLPLVRGGGVSGIDTFFEASHFGCRKTTCDVTKVTYNMYSCDTCYMSREMMEMEGLDNAKWQKSRGKNINVIL